MLFSGHIKSNPSPLEEAPETHEPQEECFAETAKPWIWLLAFLVALVLVVGLGQIYGQVSKNRVQRYRWANSSPWTVTFRPCPYCPGMVDAMGRCNIPTCRIYSSDFGKGLNSGGVTAVALVPTQSLLIQELGVDVVNCRTNRGVLVESVYPGTEAQLAGIRPGDLITRFNGRRVRNPQQFQTIVAQALPGNAVAVEFVRPREGLYSAFIRVGLGAGG
ncbi:MAG: PDZ domain-containing protein [Elusimicrobia bacterium]|nr:PDZ domain-containing protein [Candidatus Obscuribacterium magneticum]